MELELYERDALIALEETLWRVETRYDVGLIEKTFAADFVEIGRSGRRYERAEMFFKAEQQVSFDAKIPLPDYSVSLIAPNVALATYTSEVRRDDGIERGRRSSLWIKKKGRWQLRFHQGTMC